jgi:hypothetical protein
VHPHPLRLLAACWMVVAIWVLFVLSFVALLAGLAGLGDGEAMGRVFQGILASLAVLVPLQIATTLGVRCPACRGFVTLETFRPVHPSARSIDPIGRYGAVVLNVVRERRFTCMYCGCEHRLAPRSPARPAPG